MKTRKYSLILACPDDEDEATTTKNIAHALKLAELQSFVLPEEHVASPLYPIVLAPYTHCVRVDNTQISWTFATLAELNAFLLSRGIGPAIVPG